MDKNAILTMTRKKRVKKYFAQFKNPYTVVMFLFMLIYVGTFAYTIWWGLISSLKEASDYYVNLYGLPKKWAFSNYSLAFSELYVVVNNMRYYLPHLFMNSFIYAFGNVAISTVSTCFCAYLCQKYKCKLSSLIYNTYLFMLVIPIVGSVGANISFRMMLGIYDNIWLGFITDIGFNTAPLMMYYAAFAAIPNDYMDAATVDGAGHWRILLTIMFPMIKVPFAILFLVAFMPQWNDHMGPLIYLPSFPTAAVGLYRFQLMSTNATASVNVRMAATMIVCMPCLIMFIIFRNQFMGNITFGGIKG